MENEILWKFVTIGYLSALSIIGIIILIMTISFSLSIKVKGETDLLPTVGFGLIYLFKLQIIGILINGITTVTNFARYSDYAKLSLFPLTIWISAFVCNFIF
jgi:hypothetical protein